MTPADFVELCARLRATGAVMVEAHGYRASWLAPIAQPRPPAAPSMASVTPMDPREQRRRDRARALGRDDPG